MSQKKDLIRREAKGSSFKVETAFTLNRLSITLNQRRVMCRRFTTAEDLTVDLCELHCVFFISEETGYVPDETTLM